MYYYLLVRQNEGENNMEKYFFTQNCQGFGHDSLLHISNLQKSFVLTAPATL